MWWLVAVAAAADVGVGADRLEVPPVAFQSGKAELVDGSGATLDAVAATLAANPSLRLRVEVHTDSQGSDAFNLKLSQARADTIAAALVARGIAPERITSQGWGELKPIAENTTADGRARNRRVEWWTDPTTAWPPAPEPPAPVVETPIVAAPSPFPYDAFCASLSEALELVVSDPRKISLAGGRCEPGTKGSRCDFPGYDEATLRGAVDRCLPSGSPSVAVTVGDGAITVARR